MLLAGQGTPFSRGPPSGLALVALGDAALDVGLDLLFEPADGAGTELDGAGKHSRCHLLVDGTGGMAGLGLDGLPAQDSLAHLLLSSQGLCGDVPGTFGRWRRGCRLPWGAQGYFLAPLHTLRRVDFSVTRALSQGVEKSEIGAPSRNKRI